MCKGILLKNIEKISFKALNEGGFISFLSLILLVILSFISMGLFHIAKENANMARHHEIAVQLEFDAEGIVENIAGAVEEKLLTLPEDIKNGEEYTLPQSYVLNFDDENKIGKAVIKYELNGIRIFAVVEKTNEPVKTFGMAEGFMEDVDGEYKWKYWVKVK